MSEPPNEKFLGALLRAHRWAGAFVQTIEQLLAMDGRFHAFATERLAGLTSRRDFIRARADASLAALDAGEDELRRGFKAVRRLAEFKPAGRIAALLARELATLDVRGAQFDDAIFAAGVTFPGPVLAARARFGGPAWFATSVFSCGADFSCAVFEDVASFEQARFHDAATFDGACFRGVLEARELRISGAARFAGAEFLEDVWLRGGSFGGADFSNCRFSGEAGFGQSEFLGDARFDGGVFEGGAGFDDCRFGGAARFDRARFLRAAWFQNTRFEGPANFDIARFEGRMAFNDIAVSTHRPEVVERLEGLKKIFGA